jgi:signal transduction histidine kinase
MRIIEIPVEGITGTLTSIAPAPGGWEERKLSVALDDFPDGVLVAGFDGRILGVNAVVLRIVERALADVLGRSFESLVGEEDMLRIIGFQSMFADQVTLDNNVIILTPSGERRPVVVSATRSSEEKRVIMTLRSAGIMQKELADVSRWAAAEQERAMELARARDALATKHAALEAAQAEVKAAYATLQSETATRERLEGELELARRLESIGQLAAGVAHEINTPMQYIGDNVNFLSTAFLGMLPLLQTLREALASAAEPEWASVRTRLMADQKKIKWGFILDQIPKALTESTDGIGHVSRIVQAMKAFAYQDQGEKIHVDLNRTLQDTLTVAQNEYKTVAAVETDFGALPPVFCLPGSLNQVFLNLIVNAAHAIADAKRPGLGTIRVQSRAIDGQVEVRISDDGCGIPAAVQHRVFEQFFTTKEVGRGTGQGLSLVRRIVVEAHAGSVSFESMEGAGTTFIVRLPIDGPPISQSATATQG